ncbi:cell division protein PerM, partial [Leucobacter sp. M11]|uniref:cell division protein PerM n=1 Tax=Leucobacter sp. M11 TaxID=2993565 RepID=UPI002D80FA6F
FVASLVGGAWLLSTGVPLRISVDELWASSLGLDPESISFALDLIPLGLTAITLGLAARVGWRLGALGPRFGGAGVVAAVLGFGCAAWIVAAQLPAGLVGVPPLGAAAIAGGGFALAALVGGIVRSVRDGAPWLF